MIRLDDDVFNKYIYQLIEHEIGSVNESFNAQKKLYSDLLSHLQTIPVDMNSDSRDKMRTGCKMVETLLQHRISYEKLLNKLEEMKNFIVSDENYSISDNIKKYNILAQNTINTIKLEKLEIQTFMLSDPIEEINLFLPEFTATTAQHNINNVNNKERAAISSSAYVAENTRTKEYKKSEKTVPVATSRFFSLKIPRNLSFKNCSLVQNTLIVSELTKTVKLPYTFRELRDILRNSNRKYASFREIIRALYTKPLNNYKNSAKSRFKEGYNLIRHKEKGSIRDALELGFELLSNSKLHPAVIAACKDLNELDVYLSCLEYNELKDFPFFKIIFNVAPVVSKATIAKKTIEKSSARKKKIARRLAD